MQVMTNLQQVENLTKPKIKSPKSSKERSVEERRSPR